MTITRLVLMVDGCIHTSLPDLFFCSPKDWSRILRRLRVQSSTMACIHFDTRKCLTCSESKCAMSIGFMGKSWSTLNSTVAPGARDAQSVLATRHAICSCATLLLAQTPSQRQANSKGVCAQLRSIVYDCTVSGNRKNHTSLEFETRTLL